MPRRWARAWGVGLAAVAFLVPVLGTGGCSNATDAPCGSEPVTNVCSRLGYECGTATICYACGVAKRVDCGACGDAQTCGGGGTPHQCWPPLDGGVDAATSSVPDASPAAPDASTDGATKTDGAVDAAAEAGDANIAPTDASTDDASEPTDASSVTTFALCADDAVAE
jgi:hypothetical protein